MDKKTKHIAWLVVGLGLIIFSILILTGLIGGGWVRSGKNGAIAGAILGVFAIFRYIYGQLTVGKDKTQANKPTKHYGVLATGILILLAGLAMLIAWIVAHGNSTSLQNSIFMLVMIISSIPAIICGIVVTCLGFIYSDKATYQPARESHPFFATIFTIGFFIMIFFFFA
ncbi:hypothetical protein IJI89_00765 [Candidatus Saccharibacteria bacterium]|nr:hypothetical protein [Candidatus Saccharibacteria bacterium]